MPRRKPTVPPSGVLQGLETAFSRYSPQLYRYLLRRLRQPADAADLTQEIFERFLRGDGLGKARNPQAYLYGIAANVMADARLAQGRSAVVYDSTACDTLAETMPDAMADPTESLGLAQELKAALAQLPQAHRIAFLLTKWEGFSSKEAAARMNLSEGSILVYVCEARARLKTLLKQDQTR